LPRFAELNEGSIGGRIVLRTSEDILLGKVEIPDGAVPDKARAVMSGFKYDAGTLDVIAGAVVARLEGTESAPAGVPAAVAAVVAAVVAGAAAVAAAAGAAALKAPLMPAPRPPVRPPSNAPLSGSPPVKAAEPPPTAALISIISPTPVPIIGSLYFYVF
jgi:hypothetical protein